MKYGSLKWAVAGALVAVAAVAERPNVILIISDDHGFPDYGFMGSAQVRTPNIDRMAEGGVLFTRGYVTTALCSPSLASLLTGLPPHRNGITGNDLSPKTHPHGGPTEDVSERQPLIDQLLSNPIMPRMLTEAGYRTLQTGKLWNTGYDDVGFTDGMTTRGRHGGKGLDIGRESMRPVFDFIDSARADNKPFFVWYAPFLPHTPHNPPERLLAKYRGKGPNERAELYFAMVEWFDETCGELDAFLAVRGLLDNTLIVYLADNGWCAVEGNSSKRSKRSPYEIGVRTPIFARWPARVKPLRDDVTLASILDVVPTILAACGLPVPEEMPGLNLFDRAAMTARTSIFLENYSHDVVDLNDPAKSLTSRTIIDGWWKLLVATPYAADMPGTKDLMDAPIEMFNLKDDPLETRNLADQEPGTVKKLRAKLDAWWNP